MKTKHTPGPWKYTPSTKGGTVMGKVECGDNTVFSVQSHMADGQADANARLIAAAPEMLATLQALIAHGVCRILSSEDADQLEQLIAKAKGEL